jgi:hypothetical protein
MKTAIEHSCGHRTTANLYGTNVHGERDRKAEWLAARPCPACARAEREHEQQEQNRKAAEEAAASAWPALTGSDKQIAWANTIRAETVQAMADRLSLHPDAARAAEALKLWTAEALRNTDAAWWIESCGNRPATLAIRAINAELTPESRQALQALTEKR